MKIIHERDIPEISHPGRFMRWLANEQNLQPRKLSACVIRVLPGETVRPAHCHPLSEELIYIIQGAGRVMIEDQVSAVEAGSAVLFEQGKIHMLKNTGEEEMKVICFFAPATSVENYKMFEKIQFPE
ncbi:MAG: cupin domain-containing protein [Saprospiraceae bacterium]|nr:cupin domain-containing protein [Saprospiraceae bacterium]